MLLHGIGVGIEDGLEHIGDELLHLLRCTAHKVLRHKARHLCVEVITLWNGRMLTTRRHPNKRGGGYWEVTTGSALAGEDSRTAALRELYEETGITAEKEALIPFDRVITPRIFSDTYLLILNEEPKITLQSTETVDYAWLTPEEMLERCRSGIVIGHLAQRFARYAVMLRELLQKEGTQ